MPNLRSSEVTSQHLTLVASDGRTVTITRPEIIAFFQAQTGPPAERKAATVAWVAASIEAALGAEQVPASLVDFDFEPGDSVRELLITVTSG